MRLGDAPDEPAVAEAVPIRAAGRGSSVAVLDAVVPPWLRVPVARPAAVRLAAAPDEARPARPVAARQVTSRPVTTRPVTALAERRARPQAEHRPAILPARPRVVEEPSILGLSRRTRSRLGSRLFTLFFVAVFALIAVQMLVEILYG